MKKLLSILTITAAFAMCTPTGGNDSNPYGGKAESFARFPQKDLSGQWEFEGEAVPETKYYSNPVWKTKPCPDPTIIKVADWYYCYSTGTTINIIKSRDLVNWTFVGTAFTPETRPRNVKTKEGKDVGVWAPDIEFINGQYLLYYGQSAGDYLTGIGVATASSPEGPFTDRGLIISDEITDTKGNVDQFYFKDPVTGIQWLGWGSYGGNKGGLHIAELADDGLSLKDKTRIYRIAGSAWEGGQMRYRNGKYYLFISGGYCCSGEESTYNCQIAVSNAPTGPFKNRKGEELQTTAGSYQILKGNDYAVGPGHVGEIFTDDNGDEWIFYHAYVKGHADEYQRVLFLDRLTWAYDSQFGCDIPVINGGLGPSSNSPAPYIASAQ